MSEAEKRKQKPRRWRRGRDGRCCIACEAEFKTGDMVYEDCTVCLHTGCIEVYRLQLVELGLLSDKAVANV